MELENLIERDLQGAIETLYGRVDWRAATGVLQVTAIAKGDRATIALGPQAPPSAVDRFVLGFARARSEALITTGAILRSEPELRHCYAETPERDAEWGRWREQTLGLTEPPALIVLSRSGDFPERHPAIEAAGAGMLWTSREHLEHMGGAGSRLGPLEIVAPSDVAGETSESRSGLAAVIRYLREERGHQRIAVEAGPSASRSLYLPHASSAGTVDEVLLSLFEGALVPEASAAPFASEAELALAGLRKQSACSVSEPSGRWSFERHRR